MVWVFYCPGAQLRRWAVMSFCMQFENRLESIALVILIIYFYSHLMTLTGLGRCCFAGG